MQGPDRDLDCPRWKRRAPVILVVLGVLMAVVAAAAGLSSSVAITFAVLGAGLIVLGLTLPLLEGAFKVGPGGFEAQLRERGQKVIEVADANPDPEVGEAVREAVRYIDPAITEVLKSAYFSGWSEKWGEAANIEDVTERLGRLRSAPVHIAFRPDKDPLTLQLDNPLHRERLLQHITLHRDGYRDQTELKPTNVTLPLALPPDELVNVQLDRAEVPNDTDRIDLRIDDELSVYVLNDAERERLKQRDT